MQLGSPVPGFSLQEPTTGLAMGPEAFAGRPLLVAFITHDCVTVSLIRQAFVRFAGEYRRKGLATVAINPNRGAGAQEMRDDARRFEYPFAYLWDESQHVARHFGVVCTPDFFLFDAGHRLFYLGRFDATRPGGAAIANGEDLRVASDALLCGAPAPLRQTPSFGCGIVWEPSGLAVAH